MARRIQEQAGNADPAGAADFLRHYPPFDALDAEELERVAAAARLVSYRQGDNVLVEDGPPAQSFFVIRSGAMELVHEDEVIDVLEPGESFGHPSLLTGLAPTFTVRAHEDSTCLLIARDAAIVVLGRPAGAGFVAATLRERLTRTGHTVHALPPLGTTHVRELLTRPPVFADPNTTIRRAARLMTDEGASVVLVRDGEHLYVLTDAQLRAKVLAGGLSPEDVARRVIEPAVIVPPDRVAVDAVVEMLDRGVDQLVVVDRGGEVLGILTAADALGMEARSPFALRHTILRARDEEELAAAAANLRDTFVALLDGGVSPVDAQHVLTLQGDAFTARLIDFAIERHGPAPVAWAWLALGSAARRELTLASDQDNALAYADSDDPEVDAYFERFATAVNAGLARCGFGPDNASVLARDPRWRMPESRWIRVFEESLDTPDRSNLVRAAVAFDFRHVAGGLDIVPPLVRIIQTAREHPDFLRRLARTVTDYKPPLGFRGTLPSGTLDIKKGGVLPISNLARFHALANGVTISATLDRLVAVEALGALDPETAISLREAFTVVARVRLEHHAAQIEAGREPDNEIDPAHLPPLARRELREAFRVVTQAQKRLSAYAPMGL
jgi:CBS domain-containing protein